MRSSIVVLIALAAGCAQPIQPAPDAKPGHKPVQTYPNWVNLAQLPPELRPKPKPTSPLAPKLSHEKMAARYERFPNCTVAMAAFVVPEQIDGELEPLVAKLSTDQVLALSPAEAERFRKVTKGAALDIWQGEFAFRLLRGADAVARVDHADLNLQRGLVYAAEPIDIRAESCRLVFAAQGTDGPPDECAADGRTWYVADEVNLSPGQYAAKLATSPVAGETVVLLVGLRGVRPGRG